MRFVHLRHNTFIVYTWYLYCYVSTVTGVSWVDVDKRRSVKKCRREVRFHEQSRNEMWTGLDITWKEIVWWRGRNDRRSERGGTKMSSRNEPTTYMQRLNSACSIDYIIVTLVIQRWYICSKFLLMYCITNIRHFTSYLINI